MGKRWKPSRNLRYHCRKTGYEWTAVQWEGSRGHPGCPIHRRKNCVELVGIDGGKEAEG